MFICTDSPECSENISSDRYFAPASLGSEIKIGATCRNYHGDRTMPDAVFLTDEYHSKLRMRNRQFFEYTVVLILITIIILQWISHKTVEEKYIAHEESAYRQISELSKQNSLYAVELGRNKELIKMYTRFSSREKEKKEYFHQRPTIYAITPTFARPVQKAELTRLAQTFMHVPTFHWIIIEDSLNKTNLVSNLLAQSGLTYTHLSAATPPNHKLGRNDPNWKKPRGVEQRNAALKWLRDSLTPNDNGIVFFADDDNTYSIKLFEEMEKITNVGVWPVGLVGGLMVEKPICDKTTNKVTGFNSAWKPDRPFPIDMAGFAINLKLLLQKKDAWFSFETLPGHQESEILRHVTTRDQLEPLADFCTKVHVWHTRTEPPKLGAERLLIKKGKRSNEGIEV